MNFTDNKDTTRIPFRWRFTIILSTALKIAFLIQAYTVILVFPIWKLVPLIQNVNQNTLYATLFYHNDFSFLAKYIRSAY